MNLSFNKVDCKPSPLLRSFQVLLLVLIVIGLGLLLTQKIWVPKVVEFIMQDEMSNKTIVVNEDEKETIFDGRNASFIIEGRTIKLVNGVSEESIAPDSASKLITRYFGNEAEGDLNNDGEPDIAFLVTQESGGSGLFYYAVVAESKGEGYQTTNAFYVGDRIAPQSTFIPINSQELQVNYVERRLGEPMTAKPSQGAVLLLKVTPAGVLEGLMQ